MESSASFYDEGIDNDIDTEAQQEPCTRRRVRLLSATNSRTRCNNLTSVALDWTCMLAIVACLLVGLGFSWHTLQPTVNNNGGQRQVLEQMSYPAASSLPEKPFLSEQTATVYRNSPHSISELDQVVTKTLLDMPSIEENYVNSGISTDENPGERLLVDECMVDVKIEAFCEGCDEWIAQSRLQEWPWCHSELSSMTFLYTGCPCGSWYTIDYGNSTWNNSTGQTSLVYECWEPDFLSNSSDLPAEITCQDHTPSLPSFNGVDVQYNQDDSVQWIATDASDPTAVVGSGFVSLGQEYTIASSDPNTPLPSFLTLTFYDQDANVLQTTTFPSAYCPGYPDTWYRHGYSHMHIVEVEDLSSGIVSTRDTKQEALWLRVTVDASQSPNSVVLKELNVIANINAAAINLTDVVYGVELNGQGDEWTMVTREGNTRSATGRNSIYSLLHSRQEPQGGAKAMTMMVGPMTMDMYWRTRYTFFGTIVAEQANNSNVQCNGFDFYEYIGGLQ